MLRSSAADISAFCRAEAAWLLDAIEALVRLESPTGDKGAVDACGIELSRLMTECGARVTRLPEIECGDHLYAEVGPGERRVLLLGHFDTVWPVGQLGRMPFELRDGRLRGPGVLDMKAGIALGLMATRFMTKHSPAPRAIAMLWTADEEGGSRRSRDLVERLAAESTAVLVLEPSLPDGSLKTKRKGCREFRLAVNGVPAHAGGDPERGVSAIVELARQITALVDGAAALPDVTVNVGLIAGGTRPNVVPERAEAVVDVRFGIVGSAERFERALGELAPVDRRASLRVERISDRPPMDRTATRELFTRAKDIAAAVGQHVSEGETGGGSDGNFTAALGIPTLDGLGAIGSGAHGLDECVVVDRLHERAVLLTALLEAL